MKYGVSVLAVILLVGGVQIFSGNWVKYPKQMCWAEITVTSQTDETSGEIVLVGRKKKHGYTDQQPVLGEFDIHKSDGKSIISTPIFNPQQLLPSHTKLFTIGLKVNEGKLKKKSYHMQCK